MDGPRRLRRTFPDRPAWSFAVALLCALFASLGPTVDTARAAEFRDEFESSRTSWQFPDDDPQVQLLVHRRNFSAAHTGQGAEHVRISTSGGDSTVRLEYPIDPAAVLDELRAVVWIRADRPGAVLALRIRLPHQIDPQTGKPLEFEIHGQPYALTDRWEELTVGTSRAAIDKQLMLSQRRLAPAWEGRSLDERDMHVVGLSLIIPLSRGGTELLIDDLSIGPIVRPTAASETPLIAAQGDERRESPIRLGPNRITVEGRPFFPRFTAYQGENLDVLKETGINLALIENHDERILIDELSRRGIWVMAPPPPLASAVGGDLDFAGPAGLLPISASPAVLFWMLGTRIPADELRRVERWTEQIRDADRSLTRPRPIIADVISEERAFSRSVSLLGNSRHSLHTTFSPLAHRDYLRYKRLLALPDRFAFTWIQTEAAPPNMATRHPSRDRPIVVEAEQIWMQAWEAISVGHRALGYWTSSPLDQDSAEHPERRLALSLLNTQIELLEPILATGKVVDRIPVSVQHNEPAPAQLPGAGLIPSLRRDRGPVPKIHPEIQAAVIESDFGRLVIPVWYEQHAQFQPGEMTSPSGISFVVRGVEQSRAWEVTTTGVQPLDLEQPVPGGMEFRLPRFDQFAFVIITNDLELEARLSRSIRTVQQRSARLWVELARTRLNRVRPTHELLQRIAVRKVRDGDALLRSAARAVDEAEVELTGERYDEARLRSRTALQLLRRLQRSHWENAVEGHTAPVSSPHTLCFETLPDHWRMISALGRSVGTSNENLLRSGDFEDYATVRADKWQAWYDPEQDRGVELMADAYQGEYALRLVSRSPRSETPVIVAAEPSVTVLSPPVSIQGGQVVIVSGQLRVDEPLTGHPDGLMIYDNIKGTVAALRFYSQTSRGQWQPFRLIREASGSTDFRLHIELNGDGDVRVDDVRVEVFSPLQTVSGGDGGLPRPRRGRLEWPPSLPKVPFWSGRNSDVDQE